MSAVRISGAPVPAESKPVFISFCMALYAAALLKLIYIIKTHKGAKGYKAAAVFSKCNIIPPIYRSRRGALQAQKNIAARAPARTNRNKTQTTGCKMPGAARAVPHVNNTAPEQVRPEPNGSIML